MRGKLRFAVISDIHSNYLALENALGCLDELHRSGQRLDGMIFLGDYLTDFPYPQKTLHLLDECRAEFPCWFVRGNREDYLLRHREQSDDGWSFTSSSGSLLYTYENLAPVDFRALEEMPICLDVKPKNMPIITACHASPNDNKEWIMNRPLLLDRYSTEIAGQVLLCGHTHRGGVVELNGRRIIFCPSLGLPQDRRPGSKLLMLESGHRVWRYRPLTVDYDKQKMVNEFKRSGLYDKAGIWAKCIIKSMFDQRDHAESCVALAWRKAAAEGFSGSNVLPEQYWEAAAKELGLA